VIQGRLHELDLGVIPAPSGAGAVVLHSEEGLDCLLVMVVHDPAAKGCKVALVTLQGCIQSIFGYPNDEAYGAIPGASYGFYEVTETDWPDRIREFNALRFPDTSRDDRSRHFFIGCHDASGQFLARDLRVEVFEDDFYVVLERALRRLVPRSPE